MSPNKEMTRLCRALTPKRGIILYVYCVITAIIIMQRGIASYSGTISRRLVYIVAVLYWKTK